MTRKKLKRDIYQEVTDTIIAALEAGTAPWQKSWAACGTAFPTRVTGEQYRGINVMILAMQGRSAPTWMTYKQAAELGGNVRKGEKAATITFFKPLKVEKDGVEETIPLLRAYNVFNVEQIDGLPEKFYPVAAEPRHTGDRDREVDLYIRDTRADIRHGGGRAFYVPSEDYIQLPNFDQFEDAEAYYGTALHELAHWTGAEKRLDRNIKNANGTKDYAREELVAEMSAAFLTAKLGVENSPRDDHAQYLSHWLGVMKEDKKAIFKAATAAQKVVDYLDAQQTHQQEQAA
jgi:antirestriction protein ArdC